MSDSAILKPWEQLTQTQKDEVSDWDLARYCHIADIQHSKECFMCSRSPTWLLTRHDDGKPIKYCHIHIKMPLYASPCRCVPFPRGRGPLDTDDIYPNYWEKYFHMKMMQRMGLGEHEHKKWARKQRRVPMKATKKQTVLRMKSTRIKKEPKRLIYSI